MPRRLTRRQALATLGALSLPLDRLLAQTSSTVPNPPASGAAPAPTPAVPPLSELPPDLPNFHPMMEWIAREQGVTASFLDPKWTSLEQWKQTARPALHAHLSYSPRAVPLKAELIRREDRDGFTVEVVNISAIEAYSIPARVLVPKNSGGKKLPAVLALHCHSGRYTWGHEKVLSTPGESPVLTDFRNGTYGRPWAEALVKRGFVVLAIDAFYFGERRLRVEDLAPSRVFTEVRDAFKVAREARPESAEWIAATNRVCSFYEHHTAKTITATGATWPGIHVWDEMRSVTYLQSRADVDPERIG